MRASQFAETSMVISLALLFGCAPSDDARDDVYRDRGDFVAEWGDASGYEELEEWAVALTGYEIDILNEVLKLPYDVPVRHEVCGFENAYWDGQGITFCYEMIAVIVIVYYTAVPDITDAELEEAVYATWLFVLYHEVGHGVVDVYDLPVVGGGEDAADGFATVMLVESGWPDAVVYAGFFWVFLEDALGSDTPAYADEHSLNYQRFYNLECWVYGSNPAEYEWLLDRFPDLATRAEGGRCEVEYADLASAWDELLSPFAH